MKGVGKLPERWEIQSRTVPAGAGPRGKAGGGCVLGGLALSLAFAQVCVCVYWGDSPRPWPLPRCVCLCVNVLGGHGSLCPSVCVCVCVCVGVLRGLAPSLTFAQGLHTCSHSLSDAKCDRQPPVEQASPDIPLARPGPAAAPKRKPFPDHSSLLAGPG